MHLYKLKLYELGNKETKQINNKKKETKQEKIKQMPRILQYWE